jgi:Lipocalin-like domain
VSGSTYLGTYVVDARAGTVTHHLDVALAPADVERSLTRHFELNGDVLTLSFRTTVSGGAEVTRVIVWRRVG